MTSEDNAMDSRSPEIHRLRQDGGVDADGHILEPPDLWERYMDPRDRDRALRLRRDADGLEYLEIDGQPSRIGRGGMLGMVGAMGRPVADVIPSPEHTYVRSATFGAMDARERLERLD